MTVTADRRSRADRPNPITAPEPAGNAAHTTVGPWLLTHFRRGAENAVRRIRQRRRAVASTAARLTGAAVASYVVAMVLLPGTSPVVAALTALLVVEVTLFDILTSGVQRVISVIAGVSLAVAFSAMVGLTWWSLGLLIAASIVVGQLLRLGPHLLEVPISAMLVLAVNGSEVVATSRIVETIIGALVGVGVNVLFPPRIRANKAAVAVGEFADEIAGLLRSSSAQMVGGVDTALADQWLNEARTLTRNVAQVDKALEQAERSRRLNPRALLHRDSGPSLRAGLDALEHSAVAVRSMFRTITDNVPDPALVTAGGSLVAVDDQAEVEEDVRYAFATVLSDLAFAVGAFGDLVRAEVDDAPEDEEGRTTAALQALDEARVRVIELRLAEHDDESIWALNNAVLEAVDRVIAELDVQEQARHRADQRAALAERSTLLRRLPHTGR